ncbi:MAG: hypothetical protein GWN81_16250 [Phycisphaerae bacterium]|nr:hypothetical protein [Phycisphaerae bacterium]NIU10366.1 hypothetical protein [Phycisphaerae bacterium]NIW10787.1 hypothetical protein [Gammaproteobacteria bacterium]NIX29920.1 hypothetical protein [Phycisphaerae bacterium]
MHKLQWRYEPDYRYFYPWQRLFSKYLHVSPSYPFSSRLSFSAQYHLDHILEDQVFDDKNNLIRANNQRLSLNGGIEYLLYKPWQYKLGIKYNYTDHRHISPFRYTPKGLYSVSLMASFYKELSPLYVYGQEVYDHNMQNVSLNLVFLEAGVLLYNGRFGINFLHIYNPYYKNTTMGFFMKKRF